MGGSYFDGKVLGFLGNRLLSWLITILTLGIAAPWGYCMRKQWELEHTVVNNRRMKFTGNAEEAIGTWIIFLFCTYVAMGLAVLALYSFRDSDFLQILISIVVLIAAVLYVPFAKVQIMKWITKYTVFDSRGPQVAGIDGKSGHGEEVSVGYIADLTPANQAQSSKAASPSLVRLIFGTILSLGGIIALFFSWYGLLAVAVGLVLLGVEYSK